MKFTPNLVIGVVITLVGIILMLDRLEIVEIGQALRLWPVLLTVFGISVVWQALNSDKDTPGVSGRPIISPGLVLFLAVVSVVAWRADGRTFSRRGAPSDAQMSLVGIMGRDDRVVTSKAFQSADMTTLMGRTRLDLRQATLSTEGEVVVDVFGMWGAVEIIVPPNWTVDSQAWAIMGGIDDRRRRSSTSSASNRDGNNDRPREDATTTTPNAAQTPSAPDVQQPAAPGPEPRLVLRGTILMGGLVIRS
jgi:hypothetical protein